jgi:hypothetical protein
VIVDVDSLLLFGKPFRLDIIQKKVLINQSRGINEGRQAAREVDTFLMGSGSSQLPITGGIIRRSAIDTIPKPAQQHVQAVAA